MRKVREAFRAAQQHQPGEDIPGRAPAPRGVAPASAGDVCLESPTRCWTIEKLMTVQDIEEVRNHSALAREFLTKGREYLAAGDLHQASEKGWGAAAHMAKAVAIAQGWQYTRRSHFHRVMNQAGRLTSNARLALPARQGGDTAHQLLRTEREPGRRADWQGLGERRGDAGYSGPADRLGTGWITRYFVFAGQSPE